MPPHPNGLRPGDFKKTKAYLKSTLEANEWNYPNLRSTANRQLVSLTIVKNSGAFSDISHQGANNPLPAFIPMSTYIANNSTAPVTGQAARQTEETNGPLFQLPIISLQLAKAAEFFFHNEDCDAKHIQACIPKDINKFEGYGYDTKYFENAISVHFRKLSSDIVAKALPLAKMIVLEGIDTPEFQAAMRGSEKDHLHWFRDQVTNDHVYEIWSAQWKAVSFDFVHHEAIRPIKAEETLRKDLRKLTKYSAACLLFLWYQHGIKLCNSMNAPDVPDQKAARDTVLARYKIMSGWSRFEGIVFSLERLPAAPNFY